MTLTDTTMAKLKSQRTYETELKALIRQRTGQECDPWLIPQIRATAQNMTMIDKVQEELLRGSLTDVMTGSMGQMKTEVNPLLPYFDKLQRTLIMQFEALGLNYKATPSKIKEDTKKGVSESDSLVQVLTRTKDDLTDMDGFLNPDN